MGEELTVESRVSPPPLSCPKCDGLLPNELGEVRCTLCHARVRIDHPITRKKWAEEKIGCPDCAKERRQNHPFPTLVVFEVYSSNLVRRITSGNSLEASRSCRAPYL